MLMMMILGYHNAAAELLMGHRTAFNRDNVAAVQMTAREKSVEWNESEMRLCPINDFIKCRLIGKNALQ